MSDEKHTEPNPYANLAVCGNCGHTSEEHIERGTGGSDIHYRCPDDSGNEFRTMMPGDIPKSGWKAPEPKTPGGPIYEKMQEIIRRAGGGFGGNTLTDNTVAVVGAMILEKLDEVIHTVRSGVPPAAETEPSMKVTMETRIYEPDIADLWTSGFVIDASTVRITLKDRSYVERRIAGAISWFSSEGNLLGVFYRGTRWYSRWKKVFDEA